MDTHTINESFFTVEGVVETKIPANYSVRQQLHQQLKDNLHKAQERMTYYADQRRFEKEFLVGDLVYLKLQPYRQSSIALGKNLKLSSKYYGPFKILTKIKLDLPPESKVHPVFHVSQLKKKVGSMVVVQTILPLTGNDGQFLVQHIAILQRQLVKKNNVAAVKVLLQWSNLPPEDATWEDYQFLKTKFPDFDSYS